MNSWKKTRILDEIRDFGWKKRHICSVSSDQLLSKKMSQ